LVDGIAGSNPAGGMDVCYAGRGLCDELITRPEESCHVSNKIQKSKKVVDNVDRGSNLKKGYIAAFLSPNDSEIYTLMGLELLSE
jgi:hypothetical protein